MRVTVEFFGELRRFLEKGQEHLELELDEGAAVADVCRRLGIPRGDLYGASVNGDWANHQQRLAEGDRVVLFPPMAGGNRFAPDCG